MKINIYINLCQEQQKAKRKMNRSQEKETGKNTPQLQLLERAQWLNPHAG